MPPFICTTVAPASAGHQMTHDLRVVTPQATPITWWSSTASDNSRPATPCDLIEPASVSTVADADQMHPDAERAGPAQRPAVSASHCDGRG